jgi:hypothetical protein
MQVSPLFVSRFELAPGKECEIETTVYPKEVFDRMCVRLPDGSPLVLVALIVGGLVIAHPRERRWYLADIRYDTIVRTTLRNTGAVPIATHGGLLFRRHAEDT